MSKLSDSSNYLTAQPPKNLIVRYLTANTSPVVLMKTTWMSYSVNAVIKPNRKNLGYKTGLIRLWISSGCKPKFKISFIKKSPSRAFFMAIENL